MIRPSRLRIILNENNYLDIVQVFKLKCKYWKVLQPLNPNVWIFILLPIKF